MPFSLNRAELIGRIGQVPEIRYTSDGQAVTKFSLATDRPAKPGTKADPDWHSVICWQKLAEFAGEYLTKGRLVFVAGRISYRTWEGKDGQKHRATEIVATELIPLDRKPNGELRVVNGQDDASDLPF